MRAATRVRTRDRQALAGWLAVLLMLALCAACSVPTVAASGTEALAAPFDVVRQRALWGRDVAAFGSCPEAPVPVRDVIRGVYYADRANSVRKSGEFQQTMAALTPLWAFSGALNAMADDHVVAADPDPARAHCVLAWLDRWAAGGAMLGETSTWAHYDKLWGAGVGAAVAYLKVRDTPGLDASQRRRVEAWLAELARVTIAQNEAYNAWRDARGLGRSSLSYWTAAYAALAGIAAGDRALLDWGIATARTGLAAIGPDGVMAPELERKGRAFAYHVWSLEPLALVAAAAAANGIDLMGVNDGALTRVLRFMVAMREKPETFAALAGIAQQHDSDPAKWPARDSAAALEIINRLRPDAGLASLLAPLRPVASRFSGGNFTVLFGAR